MANNYSGHEWRGKNYNPAIGNKEVAKLLRQYIKEVPELAECKWSITCDGWNGLNIHLMGAPFDIWDGKWKEARPDDVANGYSCCYRAGLHATNHRAHHLFDLVENFVMSYNHDDSDGMIDYFDRHIYDDYRIGKWDKPFEIIPAKSQNEKKPAKNNNAETAVCRLVDYSAKAVAVVGDTKQFAECFKKIGGKFNPRLSCGAGWIFSKKQLPKLEELAIW